ncbi:MAG: IMP dehydrogenase, partial [Nitrososphaerota archaeon]
MATFWEGLGLTFDDVLLVPRFSTLKSRTEASTTTKLTRKLSINIPIVSAAMDTVTESRMAIAMAREGGLGIIHRFMPVKQQAAEVLKVKRAEGIIIDDPYTISLGSTVGEARREMEARNVSGLIVVDSDRRVHGILTARDIMFERDETRVEEVMTPRSRLVVAQEGVTTEEAVELIRKYKVEKIPIVDKDWRVKGLITAKDIKSRGLYPHSSRDA